MTRPSRDLFLVLVLVVTCSSVVLGNRAHIENFSTSTTSPNWTSLASAYDNDYSTYTSASADNALLYFNVTLPFVPNTTNTTLKIKAYAGAGSGCSTLACYNHSSAAYVLIEYVCDASTGYFSSSIVLPEDCVNVTTKELLFRQGARGTGDKFFEGNVSYSSSYASSYPSFGPYSKILNISLVDDWSDSVYGNDSDWGTFAWSQAAPMSQGNLYLEFFTDPAAINPYWYYKYNNSYQLGYSYWDYSLGAAHAYSVLPTGLNFRNESIPSNALSSNHGQLRLRVATTATYAEYYEGYVSYDLDKFDNCSTNTSINTLNFEFLDDKTGTGVFTFNGSYYYHAKPSDVVTTPGKHTFYYNNTGDASQQYCYYGGNKNYSVIGVVTYTYDSSTRTIPLDNITVGATPTSYAYYSGLVDNCSTYTVPLINFTMRNLSTSLKTTGIMSAYLTYDYSGPLTKIEGITASLEWPNPSNYHQVCVADETYAHYFQLALQAEYSVAGVNTTYYYDADINASVTDPEQITLYLSTATGDTDTVLFYVYDEYDSPVEGAYVYVNEYSVGENSSTTIYSLKTDDEGKALANVVYYDRLYIFEVWFEGRQAYLSSPRYVVESPIIFRIGTAEELVVPQLDLYGLTAASRFKYGLATTFSEQNFSLWWTDPDGLATSYEFKVFNRTNNVSTLVYAKTSTSNNGTYYYNFSGYGHFYAYFYVVSSVDGKTYLIATTDLDAREEYDVFGDEAVFVTFLFVGTIAFMLFGASLSLYSGSTSGAIASLGLGISLLLFMVLGFIKVSLIAIVGIIIVAGIIYARSRQ